MLFMVPLDASCYAVFMATLFVYQVWLEWLKVLSIDSPIMCSLKRAFLSLSSSLASLDGTIRYNTVQNRDLRPLFLLFYCYYNTWSLHAKRSLKWASNQFKWIDWPTSLSSILMASLTKYKVAMFPDGLIGNLLLVLCCLWCHWMLLVMLLSWQRFLCWSAG